MKIVKQFQLKIFIFTAVKNRCILHGCVFVMKTHLFSRVGGITNFFNCAVYMLLLVL